MSGVTDIFNLTDTWDDAGEQFTAIKMDVTKSAAASGSKLLNLLLNGASKLSVAESGQIVSGPLTFPITDGANGQALVTNGLGVLSWGSVSTGSPFTVTGTSTAGAEIRLPEDTDNGSNYVALKAADSLAANLTFTLPSADGTNGQALVTNGSGVWSWASVSAGSPFTVTGTSTAGAEIRLPEDTDNGSNYVALKAADSLAANLTFTLPSADGTNGQALTTNGSGVLSWATIGAAAPLTLASGTLTDPSAALTVTQTWNDAADTFRAVVISVTNTASTSSSMLLDCQVGGSSVFNVDRFGRIKPVSMQLNGTVIVQSGSNGSYGGITTLFGGYSSPSDSYWAGGGVLFTDGSSTARAGMLASANNIASLRGTTSTTGAALNLVEMTAPSSPAANQVVVYAEDNGSGKTRLMALFPSGAAQVLATEP